MTEGPALTRGLFPSVAVVVAFVLVMASPGLPGSPSGLASAADACQQQCSAPGHDFGQCMSQCQQGQGQHQQGQGQSHQGPSQHQQGQGQNQQGPSQHQQGQGQNQQGPSQHQQGQLLRQSQRQCERGDHEACRIYHLYRKCDRGDRRACEEVNRERDHERR